VNKKPKIGRIVGAILGLAIVCIVGVELAVCRFADPALFQQVTQPVSSAFHSIHQAILPVIASANSSNKELPDNQLASNPELEDDRSTQDPAVTEFTVQDGTEFLTGGNLPLVYFNQSESPWAEEYFGPDPIKGYGCGPTAMAMVVSSLSGELVDPAEMADWADQAGYCAPGSGSYPSLILGVADAFGLEAEGWTDWSAEQLSQSLASGKIFVALMSKGHFTSNGHFIILRGITLQGEVLVADPNSRDRSLIAWDPQLILDELSATRSSGAPLWCFSTLASS
jgi:hypothetical protein